MSIVVERSPADVIDGEQLALFDLAARPVGIHVKWSKVQSPKSKGSASPRLSVSASVCTPLRRPRLDGPLPRVEGVHWRRAGDGQQSYLDNALPIETIACRSVPDVPAGVSEDEFGLLIMRLARTVVKRCLIGQPPSGYDRAMLADEIMRRALVSCRKWTPGGNRTLPNFIKHICKLRLKSVMIEARNRFVDVQFVGEFEREPDEDRMIRRPRYKTAVHFNQ